MIIDRLYAWVVTEADGGHGIPAVTLGDDTFPMISSRRHVIEMMRPKAMQLLGVCLKLELVEFGARVVLEAHDNPDLSG